MRSFEGLRDRATSMDIDGVTVLVASLADIIRSKRAARRPRDVAVLSILEKTLEETPKQASPPGRRRPRK